MKWPSPRSWFPVLRKELVEQGARKRTYLVRVLYGWALLLAFFAVFYDEFFAAGVDVWQVLGRGSDMFELIVRLQFVGIFIFLPAMMSGVLTSEKERESFSLLLLTPLRPWEILLQKYFGRLVPMFTFLLLSLPLLAISYSFGGVSTASLYGGVFLLLLCCLQVGAMALMCSAFCRTSAQAFICSYLVGLAVYLGPKVFALLAETFNYYRHIDEDVVFAMFPVFLFVETQGDSFGVVLARSIPALVSTGAFLLMARVFVVRRAFVSRGSFTLRAFNWLDAFWHRANRLTGGIVLIREPDTLPEDNPIAWRQTHKKALGKLSHLLRILLLIEVPVLFIASAFSYTLGVSAQVEGLGMVVAFLWVLAGLILTVVGTSAFVSERTSRTLDLLLVAPMTGADIIRQKARGLWRLVIILAIPIATVVLWESRLERSWPAGFTYGFSAPLYLVSSALSLLVYPSLIVWVSLWIGLKVRTAARAVMTAMVVMVMWCLLPWFIAILVDLSHVRWFDLDNAPFSYFVLLSPASIIGFTEWWRSHAWEMFEAPPLVPIVLNHLWYGAILFLVRRRCLRRADRYLGRVEGRDLSRRRRRFLPRPAGTS